MTPAMEFKIALLGSWGFSGSLIAQTILTYFEELFAVGTIYSVLHKNGIQLKQYRNGQTNESQARVHELMGTAKRKEKVKPGFQRATVARPAAS